MRRIADEPSKTRASTSKTTHTEAEKVRRGPIDSGGDQEPFCICFVFWL